MERDQVVRLLALAARVDHRIPDQGMIDAWTDAAIRARWTVDAAQDAIRAHQTESLEYLMPAHVTERIKAAAVQPLLFGRDTSPPVVKLASPLHVARCKAWVKADVLRKRAKRRPHLTSEAETAKAELFAIASPEFLRNIGSEHWARELERDPNYDPNRRIDVGEVDAQQAINEMAGWVGGEPIDRPRHDTPKSSTDPLGVECDHPPCRAKIGFFCTTPTGQRMAKAVFHPSRVLKAQAAKAET